jgi:hypothetical protein
MSTLRMVRKLAQSIGAVVTDEKIGESHNCEVEAPAGMVWRASGNHCFTDSAYQPWKPDYADLHDRILMGFEPCTIPDCEWCNECTNPDKMIW